MSFPLADSAADSTSPDELEVVAWPKLGYSEFSRMLHIDLEEETLSFCHVAVTIGPEFPMGEMEPMGENKPIMQRNPKTQT